MNYYNEFDPGAAAWLNELIYERVIPAGYVDTRSIEDITLHDLRGFTQHHFFAGIGGWSHALRLAGWPNDRPVWTGSCPCQPFSAAGKGAGFADERHLWPAWFHLIREYGAAIVFGEQVATSDPWFDLVSTDLEAEDYAVGSIILGAHSVGAPHIRQRRYFVADRNGARLEVRGEQQTQGQRASAERGGAVGELEHSASFGRKQRRSESSGWSTAGGRSFIQLANSDGGNSRPEREQRGGEHGLISEDGRAGFWDRCEWLPCRDGKTRAVEPGTFPLAHGVPGRVGLLRGYGNAIVPQVAAEFIRAVM